jgi:hypothetical protein
VERAPVKVVLGEGQGIENCPLNIENLRNSSLFDLPTTYVFIQRTGEGGLLA